MKTAEEIVSQMTLSDNIDIESLKAFVSEIQLDAIAEGMTRAAKIAEQTTFTVGKHTEFEAAYDIGCRDCEQFILDARDAMLKKGTASLCEALLRATEE